METERWRRRGIPPFLFPIAFGERGSYDVRPSTHPTEYPKLAIEKEFMTESGNRVGGQIVEQS